MAARRIQNLFARKQPNSGQRQVGSSLPQHGEGEVLSGKLVAASSDQQSAARTAAKRVGTEAILREKYRALVRHYLKRLPALFTNFTGLCSHLVWAPTWPRQWSAHDLPTRSRVCRRVILGDTELLPRCRDCASRHLAKTLQSGHGGHHFTCFLGVRNFWQPISLRGCMIGLAFVQALATPGTGAAARERPPRAVRVPPGRTTGRASRAAWRELEPMSHTEFGEAARLLQLVFQHVETAALADLRKSDLTQAQQALVELQTVATRLRGELNGLVPAFNKVGPVLQTEKLPEQSVRAALACIYENYSRSLTLKQCAEQVGLNAAYLSALFSRCIGVPFKTYLTEVRVEKARELLSDPSKAVADVAWAVGYASENRFRIAFTHLTGLSPSLWRETWRMQSRSHVSTLRK